MDWDVAMLLRECKGWHSQYAYRYVEDLKIFFLMLLERDDAHLLDEVQYRGRLRSHE